MVVAILTNPPGRSIWIGEPQVGQDSASNNPPSSSSTYFLRTTACSHPAPYFAEVCAITATGFRPNSPFCTTVEICVHHSHRQGHLCCDRCVSAPLPSHQVSSRQSHEPTLVQGE